MKYRATEVVDIGNSVEARRPAPPKLPQKHKSPAEAGSRAENRWPGQDQARNTKTQHLAGSLAEALQNRFPISNSSFNIAHFRGKWAPFLWFISMITYLTQDVEKCSQFLFPLIRCFGTRYWFPPCSEGRLPPFTI